MNFEIAGTPGWKAPRSHYYKGRYVARQRLDTVVDSRIIVENKAREKLSLADRSQIVSYLQATVFEDGVLLHFGPTPTFKRYIDYPERRRG